MDRELLQDSDAVNESFWDGLGVEFEAKYIFDFRSAPREGSEVRAGRGDRGGHGTGGQRGPRHGGTRGARVEDYCHDTELYFSMGGGPLLSGLFFYGGRTSL